VAPSKPDLGIKMVNSAKYLRVITGNDKDMAAKAIMEREARIYRQIEAGIIASGQGYGGQINWDSPCIVGNFPASGSWADWLKPDVLFFFYCFYILMFLNPKDYPFHCFEYLSNSGIYRFLHQA
jgi:hypothetical protein